MALRLLQILIFLLPASLPGQFLNSYSAVLHNDPCTGKLLLEDTLGFGEGQRVLLIQMQGAQINEGNNSTFGETQALHGAGLYQVNFIDSMLGPEIFLRFYPDRNFEAGNGLQLVTYPQFDTLKITDTLRPKPWNGRTGGILACSITEWLEIQAPVIADETGFSGGASVSLSNNCIGGFNAASGYFYNSNDFRGAAKGEGIAQFITGKENGRGAQANGGGGGNDHNAGGAGGGHLSNGGDGGERDLPFFTTSCKGDYPGKKGRAVPYPDSKRLFLGGGGGAGHGNNGVGTDGGRGGGIILLQSVRTLSNNQYISSAGEDAKDTEGGDGAGGGGAGGQLLLDLGDLSGKVDLIVKGGNGGSVDNKGDDTCFGPGGGGSGGAITANFAGSGSIQMELSAGQPGITFNTTNGCNGSSNGAEAGGDGNVLPFVGLQEASIVIEPAGIALDTSGSIEICHMTEISVLTSGYVGQANWEWDTGNGFESIPAGIGFTGLDTSRLVLDGIQIPNDSFSLRYKGIDYCGAMLFSDTLSIHLVAPLTGDFDFQEDGLSVTFDPAFTGATSLRWNFGDGSQSNDSHPMHTFAGPGIYNVSLMLFNACDTLIVEKQVIIEGSPIAEISANKFGGCAPLIVRFESVFSGPGWNYDWEFQGGTPNFSNEEDPQIVYNSPGSYDVRLVVSTGVEADTILMVDYISVLEAPDANFQWEANGLSVDFNFTGTGNRVSWDFGDGASSDQQGPGHIYSSPGTYQVVLVAENFCGKDTLTTLIRVGLQPSASGSVLNANGCSPLTATWTDRSTGQTSRTWIFNGGIPALSSDSIVEVRYEQAGVFDVMLIAENNFGTDSLLFEDAMDVTATPSVDFGFTANGLRVNFENLSSQANLYRWNFGDGSPFNNATHPVHNFPAPGQYFVTLEGINEDCSASVTRAVNVMLTYTSTAEHDNSIMVYPNPFVHSFFIKKGEGTNQEFPYRLFDATGKKVSSGKVKATMEEISVSSLPSGMYVLQVLLEKKVLHFTVIKTDH